MPPRLISSEKREIASVRRMSSFAFDLDDVSNAELKVLVWAVSSVPSEVNGLLSADNQAIKADSCR